MNLTERLVEKRAGIRFHRASVAMVVWRRALAHIGNGTSIISPTLLQEVDRISIGSNVIIRSGTWLAVEGESSSLGVGSETHVGHRCHLHSIDPVSIGRGCVLADNVMVTTTDRDRVNRLLVHGTDPIVIGDDASLGQNAVVGLTIGSGATVAAGAVVTRDLASGAVVGGVTDRALMGDFS